MYSALTIAKYIILWCNDHGFSVSNLKLQKILYFVQAEFLVSRGGPCFYENIEAWDFGPVIPEVYHEYKIYGGASIPVFKYLERPMILPGNDRELIDGIVNECVNFSASSLVEITHNQSPWQDVYRRGCNNVISNASIREYFLEG